MSFIKRYLYCGKTNEELVETRMRQYNTMKIKTKPDYLARSSQHEGTNEKGNLQAYYWRRYLEHNKTKVDPCRAGWL